MEVVDKWYFTKEQLENTPSIKCGFDSNSELICRQQTANFIQDMGKRLQVNQLCISTATVYMHRFYLFHSLTRFHCNAIAAAALFLATKVEEQPRKLENVVKVAHMILHRDAPPLDIKSQEYVKQSEDLVVNENVILQTLGFDVRIDHPHSHVVRSCQSMNISRDFAHYAYTLASTTLHLTTMCLQYKPTVVACFCIHLAWKWSNYDIPFLNVNKSWFYDIDKSVTQELLEQLIDEFLIIYDKCPSRVKRKIASIDNKQDVSPNQVGSNQLNKQTKNSCAKRSRHHHGDFQPTAQHRNPMKNNKKIPNGNMLP